ncbi:GNAT family N-acetyltransferase [Paraburkholderia megapolitana]|uniref:GNAT family N-acetyltransferase n=2 Tax=Burkholderiaceae TaxID=119060 RepID=UPI001B8753CB|nr:GNAT family N-acetyltransferase [Paraburkholderia megapolitana]
MRPILHLGYIHPMIETERLILRPHRLADFEAWYAMFTDRELFQFIAAPTLSREDGWNRLLRYAGHWSLLGFGLFAVFRKSDGQFIGETGLADFHRALGEDFDGYPEAAWIISRSMQGQGVALEAAAAAHRWIDETLSPKRTVCLIGKENLPSFRIASRLGYKPFAERSYKGSLHVVLERVK